MSPPAASSTQGSTKLCPRPSVSGDRPTMLAGPAGPAIPKISPPLARRKSKVPAPPLPLYSMAIASPTHPAASSSSASVSTTLPCSSSAAAAAAAAAAAGVQAGGVQAAPGHAQAPTPLLPPLA
eukprot:1335534-Rhodomonas_salina.1